MRVNIDYHVEFDKHYYSVHYSNHLSDRREMELRATATSVEIFHGGKRIAAHARSYDAVKRYVTLPEHMPAAHRNTNLEWPPSRFIAWGKSVGPATEQFITQLLERRRHPEQAFKSCMGGTSTGRSVFARAPRTRVRYGASPTRILVACRRTILKNNRDAIADDDAPSQRVLSPHENVRGAGYYH